MAKKGHYLIATATDALSRDSENRPSILLALKLCEEAGEVAREIKKIEKGKDRHKQLKDELGDVFSAMLKIGHIHGITFNEILDFAIEKRGLDK